MQCKSQITISITVLENQDKKLLIMVNDLLNNLSNHWDLAEVCRAPTPTPTQTGLDSTTPNIGAGVAIGRGWSLDGAEFKAYY